MNFLSAFISPSRIINKASLQSQKRIFEVLSQLLQDEELNISSDLLYQKLFERERIGSTAIGKGVVVPHCRVDGLTITRLAVLTLNESIEYDTAEQKVGVFIAVIFPKNVSDVHIQFIAELVKFLKSPGVLDSIHAASSNEELYQIFFKDEQKT
ncbi:PTS sugar transporter subunit IIA [Fastidiosibacter lacustris]|uniref:PTS sugar transporter subunit IIA n=1 Tax=Fastidiosibacter lacustris TaxID=2056695 RepID=UPI000E34F162|nr:PTS sugar transporter subunit IIA [Fastidiosibacter lacustris]